MRFWISDTHFGHKNIIEYCDRPFKSVSHMNETLIENWNNVVSDEDTVYHLGDVALGPWDEWDGILTRLNGRKILVVGNHDRVFEGEPLAKRQRFAPYYDSWFNEVHHRYAVTNVGDHSVNMSHFPYEADHMDKARHMEYRIPDGGQILVHGHTHLDQIVSYSEKGTLQVHVGADAWDYTPVSEDQLIKVIETAKETVL